MEQNIGPDFVGVWFKEMENQAVWNAGTETCTSQMILVKSPQSRWFIFLILSVVGTQTWRRTSSSFLGHEVRECLRTSISVHMPAAVLHSDGVVARRSRRPCLCFWSGRWVGICWVPLWQIVGLLLSHSHSSSCLSSPSPPAWPCVGVCWWALSGYAHEWLVCVCAPACGRCRNHGSSICCVNASR